MKNSIAVVDDDKNIIKLLKYKLEKEGYKIYPYSKGKEILEESKHRNFDLILLDLVLPDIDGWDVYREIKKNEETKNVPVIIMSAVFNKPKDEIKSFKLGAVDFLEKPFKNVFILKERVRSMINLTKNNGHPLNTITIGNISLHYEPMELKIDNKSELLTKEECKVLHILMKHQGRLVEYDVFNKYIWKYEKNRSFKKGLKCVIGRLRKKLGPENKDVIKTVKNKGYLFEK